MPVLPIHLRPSIRAPLVFISSGITLGLFQLLVDVRDLPGDVRWLSAALFWAGIGLCALGAAALRWPRALAWLSRVLGRAGAWLGVRPVQVVLLIASPSFVLTTAVLAAGDASRMHSPLIAVLAWLIGIGLALLGGLRQLPPRFRPARAAVFWFVALALLALILRGIDVTHIPVTLTGDEADTGLNALNLLQGRANNLFGSAWRGFPTLYFFIQSLSIRLFGQTISALRLTSALAGALTVGAVYWMGRAMFGQRTGLAAALFLAALHFHIHFSRIALGNIWDGLWYVVTLGALWVGWGTRRRAYFLLAGLGLGFAQYFYLTSRVLIPLVLVWLVVAGLLDRARLKRALPDICLMFLTALVIVAPLAWYYAHHFGELTGSTMAQSYIGARLTEQENVTGLPGWELLANQVWLGLKAYTFTPVLWFYRPNTPILRLIPAFWFGAGILLLARRPRDTRFWLLAFWLLAFGVIGGLSESTPAAQRYVAVAPALAILVGYGVTGLAAWICERSPHRRRLIWSAAFLLLALMSTDELRFYFLEYVPNSHYTGKYDFEGYGAAVSLHLAAYLQRFSSQWQVQFFGAPDLSYFTIPSLRYLAPDIRGADAAGPWGSPENPPPSGSHQIYVFLPHHDQDFAAAQASLPGGLARSETDLKGDLLYNLYQLPALAQGDRTPAWDLASNQGLFQPVFLWSGAFVLLAAALFWSLRRRHPAWIWCEAPGEEAGEPAAAWSAVSRAEPEGPGPPGAEEQAAGSAGAAPAPGEASASSGPTGSGFEAAADPPPGAGPGPKESPAEADEATGAPDPATAPAGEGAADQSSSVAQAEPGGAPSAGQPTSPPQPPPAATGGPAVARVHITVDVPQGTSVQVTVSAFPGQPVVVSQQTLPLPPGAPAAPTGTILPGAAPPAPAPRRARLAFLARWRSAATAQTRALVDRIPPLPTTLFGLAVLLYLATRLVGLADWPIYFFTDEAVQTTLAADFVGNNFRDRSDEFFPTFFDNAGQYEMCVSVYVQVLPYLLFGKSVFVTRLTSVLITVLGVIAVALTLRDVFDIPYWWSGALLLSIAPAWFLHSRTAFETGEATALYACFIYFYLLYRYKSPRYLYLALVFGALTFYTYSPAQLVVVLAGFLLLISDWRYHWQQRAIAVRGLGLLALLFLPYARFLIGHTAENTNQLKILRSYWLQSIPFTEKIGHYFGEYLYGLSPGYWFVPNGHDLTRHLMLGYGHLLRVTLPFAALGLGLALVRSFRNRRASAYRAVLIAMLAAPSGSALVGIGITRSLFFVIPAVLLTALGVAACLAWLERRGLSRKAIALSLFAGLSLVNIAMTRDALVNGPTWFTDYTLGGMQYGARQVFGAILDYLPQHPGTRVILSPDWTNGADEVAHFFLPEGAPVQLGSILGHMIQHLPLDDNMLFVMMAREYEQASASGKFRDIRVEQTIPYPNGQPGFYFVRLRYVDNIDAILAAEEENRKQLQEGEVILDGQAVPVKYSLLDMGEIGAAFDGNLDSLVRTMEANPFVVDLTFPQARPLQGLTVRVGGAPTTLTVRVTPLGSDTAEVYTAKVDSSIDVRDLTINFRAPLNAQHLLIQVRNTNDQEPAHVHVWEITLH